MIYNLNHSQWNTLWCKIVDCNDWAACGIVSAMNRIDIWNQRFKEQTNLMYRENSEPFIDGFYGQLIGEDKDIYWFILKL